MLGVKNWLQQQSTVDIILHNFIRFVNLILNQHTHTENKDINDTIQAGTLQQLGPITMGLVSYNQECKPLKPAQQNSFLCRKRLHKHKLKSQRTTTNFSFFLNGFILPTPQEL